MQVLPDPGFEDMHKVVCVDQYRPQIPIRWEQDKVSDFSCQKYYQRKLSILTVIGKTSGSFDERLMNQLVSDFLSSS